MKKAAVVGNPIEHSLSPIIFEIIGEILKGPHSPPNFSYEKRKLRDDELESFLRSVRKDSSWMGFNVTLPFKQRIMSFMDEIDVSAQFVRAVNVVKLSGGRAKGFNSDSQGFMYALKRQIESRNISSGLIIGTGGAARAVAYGLGRELSGPIYILGREGRDELLVSEANLAFCSCDKFQSGSPTSSHVDLIINATPIGMRGFQSSGRAPWEDLSTDCEFGFDLIYRPQMTFFMTWAEKRGARVFNGLQMLVQQALLTWEIWFEYAFDEEEKFSLGQTIESRLMELV